MCPPRRFPLRLAGTLLGLRLLPRQRDRTRLARPRLARRRFERRCQPRPLALRLGERVGDRRRLLRRRAHALELARDLAALRRGRFELGAQPRHLVAVGRELERQPLELRRPTRELGAQPIALRGHRERVERRRTADVGVRVGRPDAAPHRLDHARELAQRLPQHRDVALREGPRRRAHEDQRSERRQPRVHRDARDRPHARVPADERRHVAVLGRVLDQVGPAIDDAVKRDVPAAGIAATDRAQPAAALVGDAGLGRQPQDRMARIVQAERSPDRAGRFDDGAERGLERVLGHLDARGDRSQLIEQRRLRRRHRPGLPAAGLRRIRDAIAPRLAKERHWIASVNSNPRAAMVRSEKVNGRATRGPSVTKSERAGGRVSAKWRRRTGLRRRGRRTRFEARRAAR